MNRLALTICAVIATTPAAAESINSSEVLQWLRKKAITNDQAKPIACKRRPAENKTCVMKPRRK